MRIFFLFFCLISCSFAYRILCVFPAPSRSHDNLAKGVVYALLKAGHQVVWVTPFEQKNVPANLTIIDVSHLQSIMDAVDMSKSSFANIAIMRQMTRNLTLGVSEHQDLRRMVVEEQFDAVVTVYMMNDYDGGYAAVQGVPWILLSTWSYHPHLEWQVDEVRSISTTPLLSSSYDASMPFWSRMLNGLAYVAMSVDWWFEQSRLEGLYTTIFKDLAAARGVPLAPFREIQRNVSILLVNSHESIGPPAVKPPNVINIAGYHIDDEPPALPKDLQELLDNSPQGVIYFSMGSILRSSTAMKKETVDALLQKFGALKQTVLWKFEEDLGGKLPKNVHVRPWMPQQSILVHPNIRVFITHGGQLSTLEAVKAGIPLLAIPVFADQHSNAERARNLGYALKVEYGPDMAEEVGEKLGELLKNQTYYNRAKYLSKLFNSRPVKPSKLISHYVELAIETKGAYHLRSLSLQYSWIERWMLDLVLLLLVVMGTLITIITLIIKACYRKFCNNNKSKNESNKTKKMN